MSLDSFCLLTDLPASVFNTSTLRGLSYADCYLCIQCRILKKLFRSVVTYRLRLYVCLQATTGRRKNETVVQLSILDLWSYYLLADQLNDVHLRL